MKLRVPAYFEKFKCKCGSCTDSCCVGWEIDIDPVSLDRYSKLGGKLGERLRDSILLDGGTAHFRTLDGRCAHLRSDGLCDLICELGEGILCDICREHPRYYTTLGETVYGGIGMSCEAAAELILGESGEHCYKLLDAVDAEYEACDDDLASLILSLSDELVHKMSDCTSRLLDRLSYAVGRILDLASDIDGRDYYTLPNGDTPEAMSCVIDVLLQLEYMNDTLPNALKGAKTYQVGGCVSISESFDRYMTNIFIYLLDRYMPAAALDGDLIGTLSFILASLFIVSCLVADKIPVTLDEAVGVAKLWSSEIEYSEENVDRIKDEYAVLVPKLIKILNLNIKK